MSAGASTVVTSWGDRGRTLPQSVPWSPNQWPAPLSPTRPDQRRTGTGQARRPSRDGQGRGRAGQEEELARQAVGGKRICWWRPANGRGPDGAGATAPVENPDDAAVAAGSNGAGEPCICHAQGGNDAWGPGPGSGRFSVAAGASSLRFTKKPGEGDAYRCGCWGGTNVLWGCASH